MLSITKSYLGKFILAATVVLLSGAAQAESYRDWFGYDAELETTWTFHEIPGTPNEVRITRKGGNGPTRKVFALYPKKSSAYDVAISKILTVFQQKEINAEFTIVNFDKDAERAAAAVALAESQNNELIFSMGSVSTAYMWDNYQGGHLPVVSVCSKDPVLLGQAESYDKGTGTNFAFTSLNMPVEVQFAYIQDFMPTLRNFAILVDNKNISAVETQSKPMAILARNRGINVLTVGIDDPINAQAELTTKVADVVALMRKSDPLLERSMFWITGSTSVFREIATINKHSDRVPVLAVVPDVVKEGPDTAVMSIGISFQSNAYLAGIYGVDVLTGTSKVGDLKVGIVSPPDIAISFLKSNEIGYDVPFSFVESAGKLFDVNGKKNSRHQRLTRRLPINRWRWRIDFRRRLFCPLIYAGFAWL